jgi:hypothetical protein
MWRDDDYGGGIRVAVTFVPPANTSPPADQ